MINKISTRRCLELEEWLKKSNFRNMTFEEYANLLFSFPEEERVYIFNAKMMPKEEIAKDIEYYDSHKFPNNVDELLFLNNLALKYYVNKDNVIARIRQVRQLLEAEKAQIEVKKRKK